MKTTILIAFMACALMTGPVFGQNNVSSYNDYTVSGPFTHQNLSIFLFTGKDTMPGKEIYTLEEALDKKFLVVHETGDVNQLKVTNKSKEAFVSIMAGDIINNQNWDVVYYRE